jgi:WXG100 family type VII secretion target
MTGPSGVIDQGAGVLEQAAREVAAAKADLDRIASRLAAQVEPMAASWQGAGAGAFFGFHQAWQAKEQRIVAILTGFAEAIDATHTTTTAVDAGESSTYRTIAGRLG